jgi:hydroxymethylglutaryl-CoA synthase
VFWKSAIVWPKALRAGAPLHLSMGDGGAAAAVADEAAVRLLGWASLSRDLVDVYASREHPEPYAAEE